MCFEEKNICIGLPQLIKTKTLIFRIIATWTVILYATGILCIVYMILREYPPPPIADFDGITFSKLSKRLSLEPAVQHSNTKMEIKI